MAFCPRVNTDTKGDTSRLTRWLKNMVSNSLNRLKPIRSTTDLRKTVLIVTYSLEQRTREVVER